MNGNGLSFDISDDVQFRYFVIQKLTSLEEKSKLIPDLVSAASKVSVLEVKLQDLRNEYDKNDTWDRIKEYTGYSLGPIIAFGHMLIHKITTGKW